MTTTVAQLRARNRVSLKVPVLFEWRANGHKYREPGLSRDMSSEGMYVVSDTCPPVLSVARCRFVLPALEPELIYEAVVIGRVTRIEYAENKQVGFAVHARVMLLREPEI